MAAQNSNEDAYYLLSQIYRTGEGTPVNIVEAKFWYGKYLDFKKQYSMYEENEKIVEDTTPNDYYETNFTANNVSNENTSLSNTSQLSKPIIKKDEANTQKIANQTLANERDNSYKSTVIRPTQKRIALVIGNSTYNASKRLDNLNCPGKDAEDVYSRLKMLGFEMMPLLKDASEKNMRTTIKEFAQKAKNYDVALFFYSGHGIQSAPGFNSTNYLIPSDAKLEFSEKLEGECIDLNKLVINNLSIDNTLAIVLIDACRTVLSLPSKSDMSYNSKGNGNELIGLSRETPPEGVCVVYATKSGKIATEPKAENSNSFFTQGLLECLEKYGDKNLPDFISKLKERVKTISNKKQVPADDNEYTGDFYFNPNK